MNTLNSQPASAPLSSASQLHPKPGHRLIVLIPSSEADVVLTTRRVWELANAASARIQFISLYSDAAQEPGLRRQLIVMSAMVNDGRVFAEIEAVFGKDWVELVRSRWQAGDVVACFAEHRVGPLNRPLSNILQSSLGVPLYILSGFDPQKETRSNWLVQVMAWMGSLGIIFGFFLLQIRIDQLAGDWTQIILLLISVCVEIWMIWVWNSLFG